MRGRNGLCEDGTMMRARAMGGGGQEARRRRMRAAGSSVASRQPTPAHRFTYSGSPAAAEAFRNGLVRWCWAG
jgi:hypothetical protein